MLQRPSQADCGSVRDWRVNAKISWVISWVDLYKSFNDDQGDFRNPWNESRMHPSKGCPDHCAHNLTTRYIHDNFMIIHVTWWFIMIYPQRRRIPKAHVSTLFGIPSLEHITCGPPTLKPGPEGFRSQMTMLSSWSKRKWVSCDDSTEVRNHGQYEIIWNHMKSYEIIVHPLWTKKFWNMFWDLRIWLTNCEFLGSP